MKNGDCTIRFRSYDGKNYSDEKSITVKVKNKDGGGGFLPGFDIMTSVVVVTFIAVALARKKRSGVDCNKCE